MKLMHAFISALVGGVVLALTVNAQAQTGDKTGYATVVRIQGQARYSLGDNVWHPLVVGKTLRPGSLIQTSPDSKVDVVLGDRITEHLDPEPGKVQLAADNNVRGIVSYQAVAQQNVIRLQGDTVLAVDQLMISDTGADTISNTELDLRQGTIWGTVKKLSASSRFVVKTPNGMAGIRGTTFVISANGDITVVSGSMIAVHTDAHGQTTTVVLGPGDQYNPVTGQTTHLTPQQYSYAIQTSIFMVTLQRGIINFANDSTLICVSPTRGRGH